MERKVPSWRVARAGWRVKLGCRKSQPDHRHDYPRRTRHIVPEDRNTALRISKADQNRPVLERRVGALASSQLWLPWRGPTENARRTFFWPGEVLRPLVGHAPQLSGTARKPTVVGTFPFASLLSAEHAAKKGAKT